MRTVQAIAEQGSPEEILAWAERLFDDSVNTSEARAGLVEYAKYLRVVDSFLARLDPAESDLT
jgi:hypothetical protein